MIVVKFSLINNLNLLLMIKKLLLFTAFAIATATAMAQASGGFASSGDNPFGSTENIDDPVPEESINRPRISLGIKAGASYCMAGNPDGLDLGMSGNIGWQGGIAANANITAASVPLIVLWRIF